MRESIGLLELKAAMERDGLSNGPGFLFSLAPAERDEFTRIVRARNARAPHLIAETRAILASARAQRDPWNDAAGIFRRRRAEADLWAGVADAFARGPHW